MVLSIVAWKQDNLCPLWWHRDFSSPPSYIVRSEKDTRFTAEYIRISQELDWKESLLIATAVKKESRESMESVEHLSNSHGKSPEFFKLQLELYVRWQQYLWCWLKFMKPISFTVTFNIYTVINSCQSFQTENLWVIGFFKNSSHSEIPRLRLLYIVLHSTHTFSAVLLQRSTGVRDMIADELLIIKWIC